MSVRAYRVNNIDRAHNASFNLWSDRAIMDWLRTNTHFLDRLNDDACGTTDVAVDELKRMVKELAGVKDAHEALQLLQEDIAWAETHRNDWIQYDCF